MSKYDCGQAVFLFNSIACKIEEDNVYCVLYEPVPVDGGEPVGPSSIKERIESGQLAVKERYQLCGHQGILDADILFASPEECRAFYREFFAE